MFVFNKFISFGHPKRRKTYAPFTKDSQTKRASRRPPSSVLTATAAAYFRQNPSLPFVTTRQFFSFSRYFIPVSAPVAALIVSILPFRTNSI